MDINLVVLDGERIERVGRILLVLIAKHRRARRSLEAAVNENGGGRSLPADSAIAAEREARHALLAFSATTMVDVAAKAAYVRTLLVDGASGLDENDWEMLLQSFSWE
ncbi:hypothetical protein [Mesorhizobium sp. WSM2239]|uniref:Uncharacterized protein n=2 Tax=unclassified Mesorhizobium TaxID=325217 RepID=A0AAU8DJB0_9HYPH